MKKMLLAGLLVLGAVSFAGEYSRGENSGSREEYRNSDTIEREFANDLDSQRWSESDNLVFVKNNKSDNRHGNRL